MKPWLPVLAAGFFVFVKGANAGATCPNPVLAWVAADRGEAGGGANVVDTITDSTGNVYLVGILCCTLTDMDPTEGVDLREAGGDVDAYVTKLGPDGSYQWTRTAGGQDPGPFFPDNATASGVVVTARGTVLVVGSFAGTVDFDPGEGVDERTVIGDGNAFIWTLDQNGAYLGTVIFGTRSGIGQSGANPRGIALDPDDNILITGLWAGELDFDPGPDLDRHQSPGNVDVFVTKFFADGAYGWTRTFGGFGWDEATGVASDADGNVLVTGNFRGSADFDPTDDMDVHSAQVFNQNIFVTKLGADGSYRWTRTLPVWDTWSRRNIAVDAEGNSYVASTYEGTVDLDPTDGEDWRTANDDGTSTFTGDAFVTRINTDGSYGWTYTAGGALFDQAFAVGVHQEVGVVILGAFQEEVDFDPGPGAYIHTGFEPGFITALGFDGAYRWTRSFGHTGSAIVHDVTIASDGAIIPVGRAIGTVPFDGAVDFNPGCA